MKRIIAIGLTVIVAMPSIADDKVPTIPNRVNGTAKIEKVVQDFKNKKYLEEKSLDASTWFKLQQYFEPHENDTVANRQLITGASAISAAAGWNAVRWAQAKRAARLQAAVVAVKAPTSPIATAVNGGRGKVRNLNHPTPKVTAPTTAPAAATVVKPSLTASSLKWLNRGATLAVLAAGAWEIKNGVMSNSMIATRNEEIRNKARRFVGTPLEEAMRFQLGQDAVDEIIAAYMTPAKGDGAIPEEVMAVKWTKEEDLIQLGQWAEEAKAVFTQMIDRAGGEKYIKDANVRDELAEFYADRFAILKLILRDGSEDDQASYERKLQNKLRRYESEIITRLQTWDEKTATSIPQTDDTSVHGEPVDGEVSPETH